LIAVDPAAGVRELDLGGELAEKTFVCELVKSSGG
jgi:hypothetical protein